MVSIKDLKRVVLFRGLPDNVLEILAPMIRVESIKERQVIYKPNSAADYFYSVKRGKVLLETELAPTLIISLSAIKPGYSFGWSALFPPATHTSYAVSAEPSEILVIPGAEFLAILDQDYAIGYAIMRKMVQILESRLEHRTAQFLRVITKHPEIGALLGI